MKNPCIAMVILSLIEDCAGPGRVTTPQQTVPLTPTTVPARRRPLPLNSIGPRKAGEPPHPSGKAWIQPSWFGSADKMGRITLPVLIVHGQDDVPIPASDAHELHRRCASPDKQLVLIPHAGHNDLMMVGMKPYMEAIKQFVTGEAGI